MNIRIKLLRTGVVVPVLSLLLGCHNHTEEVLLGSAPVTKMNRKSHGGKITELYVHVQHGVRLNSLIDFSYFDGFSYTNDLEFAKSRLGEPQNVRIQADMGGGLKMHLYPTTKGEIGFIAVPASGAVQNQVWAFPSNQLAEAIILDASLRDQLERALPNDNWVRVAILRDVGWGGMTLKMKRGRIEYLILGPRDGEN
jgi:hypothetical protein